MEAAGDKAPLTDPASFRHWTDEKFRFSDTDMVGHVNNAVYATLLESGRVSFLYEPERPLRPPGHDFVIVRLVIDFRAEAHYPGKVRIGTRLIALGGRSFTLGQGIFDEGGASIATGESVLVLIDHESRRAVPLPGPLRERLQAL
jgi:acyl-CoA thioester hydrolase